MLRNSVLVVAALTVFAGTSIHAATLQETLFGLEMQICNAIAQKDAKAFNELVAPDAMIAEKGKMAMVRQEGFKAHVEDVKIDSFKLLDPKVVQVSDDVAILSFLTDVNATEKGKKMPGKNHVSTTFAKRDGKWLAVYSTSYPVE